MTAKTVSSQVPVKRSAAGVVARPAGNLFASLHHEIDRLFEQFGRSSFASLAGASVNMDMAETADGIELTVEVPGMDQNDLQVSLTDHTLTVSGEKTTVKEGGEKDYYFTERSYGSFSRSVELPADARLEKLDATLANGVLKVTVPRTAKPEAKKIEVKSAA